MTTKITDKQPAKDPVRVAAGKQGGRPYAGRTANIQVKLTEAERQYAIKRARAQSLSMSELFRLLLVTPEPQAEETIQIIFKNQPTYISPEQAKDLYKQLTKIFIGD